MRGARCLYRAGRSGGESGIARFFQRRRFRAVKRLGLLRHAKSDWDDMSLRDFDRGLNDRGRKGARLMGEHILAHGGIWHHLIASPAQRVKRTIEASGLEVPVIWDDRAYLADSDSLLKLIVEHAGEADAVLLAAHNPGLHDLALELVGSPEESPLYDELLAKFPTAAFAVLELDIDSWDKLAHGCAKLTHFARPRDLDPELGPLSGS